MIEDTFLKLKSNLELSDTFQKTIARMQNAMRSVVDNNHPGVKNIKLIGSVGRKTRIQPPPGTTFDIDMLVVFGEFDRWVPDGQGISKEKALDNLHSAVTMADRYSKKNPDIDSPTVTVEYENGVKIELVPAWIDNIGKGPYGGPEHTPKGRAYWVPSRTGWQLADYDFEAEFITRTNADCGGMLIPTVKMLKAAKREHFPLMKSYHLEVIATRLIPDLMGQFDAKGWTTTYHLLVANVLYVIREQLDKTWGIPGSLSPTFRIDPTAKQEFLNKAPWIEKQVKAAIEAKTDADKHLIWKTIFNDQLPLS
jgi:hypothetical protein